MGAEVSYVSVPGTTGDAKGRQFAVEEVASASSATVTEATPDTVIDWSALPAARRTKLEFDALSADAGPDYCKRSLNPHLDLENGRKYSKSGAALTPFAAYRQLHGNQLRAAYHLRTDQLKPLLHWGQRKLLLTEIEFLTNHLAPTQHAVVYYVGAANGTHILCLLQLFKNVYWHLFDPAVFDVSLQDQSRVRVHNERFTDELAKGIAELYDPKHKRAGTEDDPLVFFICDTWTKQEQVNAQYEKQVEENLLQQADWHQVLAPDQSLLKFRFPYDDRKTMIYLDGEVFLQPFVGQTSTETRLVVPKSSLSKTWDCVKYEQQLFYHNVYTRMLAYPHPIDAPGLDHCYDCRSEVEILGRYYLRYVSSAEPTVDLDFADTALVAFITQATQDISATLSGGHQDSLVYHTQNNLKKQKESL